MVNDQKTQVLKAARWATQKVLGSPIAGMLAGPHSVDHYLELFQPSASIRHTRARIVDIKHQTPDSVTLTLKPTWSWSGFTAGQHIDLAVEINGTRHRRCYSPAGVAKKLSIGESDLIEITARTHPEGVVSRFLKHEAKVGDYVGLSQAQGSEFALPESLPQKVVLISGGSGITPVLSMLRTLLTSDYTGNVSFLHYARGPQDLLYSDELAELASKHPNLNLLRSFTRSSQDSSELSGHFEPEHLLAALGDTDQAGTDFATFVCGPGTLVDAVRGYWQEQQLKAPLAYEHFAPAPLPEIDPSDLGTIQFSKSGISAEAINRPLLEQAETAGITPKHGCRMGICTTCSCIKTDGYVRNILTGEISSPGEEEIRICISVPIGDVAIDL